MRRGFLKSMGLDKLVIDRIMAVYNTDVDRYKQETAQCRERIRALEKKGADHHPETIRFVPSPTHNRDGADIPRPCQSEQDDRRKLD